MNERDFCIFADQWDDDDVIIPVCSRVHDDLYSAVEARKTCSFCKFYITYADLITFQDAGKIPEILD